MKFTVYSKEGCPYCDKIKTVLELTNLDHVLYELDRDFSREQFQDQFGHGSTFPQVVLNDETRLGGCSDTIKFLQESNII